MPAVTLGDLERDKELLDFLEEHATIDVTFNMVHVYYEIEGGENSPVGFDNLRELLSTLRNGGGEND
jgi:hypothetical protein